MGLYDRSYMQQENPSDSGRAAVWWLIIINAAIYFLFDSNSNIYRECTLNASKLDLMTPVQLLTCGFLHGDFTHLLFNMYGLYLFGSIAAPALGEKRFYTVYFSGIILGSLAFYILNFGKAVSLLGASGAICAITVAAAMVEPEKQFIIIFMPFTPIKITTMVICYTLINFLMSIGNSFSTISYLAHLAGFIAGYAAMKAVAGDIIRWDPLKLKKAGNSRSTPPPRQSHFRKEETREDDASPVSSAELDALLDKISREGINSLSEYELSRLRRARKQMRGE